MVRYRYRGRLTCVIKGKRQSAPKRTRIDLFNKVGKFDGKWAAVPFIGTTWGSLRSRRR